MTESAKLLRRYCRTEKEAGDRATRILTLYGGNADTLKRDPILRRLRSRLHAMWNTHLSPVQQAATVRHES